MYFLVTFSNEVLHIHDVFVHLANIHWENVYKWVIITHYRINDIQWNSSTLHESFESVLITYFRANLYRVFRMKYRGILIWNRKFTV